MFSQCISLEAPQDRKTEEIMKTILYLGNTYCSNITELKSIIDRSPIQDSLLGKELLCALKDGTLGRWLNEGNDKERSLADKIYQIQSGSSDSDLLKKLGECFKSDYKIQKLNLTDFIVLQAVEVAIDNRPSHSLPLIGANIVCLGKVINMFFVFKFKVEKTIGENVDLLLRISVDDKVLEQTKVQEINLRELNNTLEMRQALSYNRPKIKSQSIPKIELVSTFMRQESVLWLGVLLTNIINIDIDDISFKMIFIEGGIFDMGAGYYREEPVHKVTVDSFFIAETQVTQELWTAVMNENPSRDTGDMYPVNNISWKDCQLFISRLNQITGLVFRLPTEAEWEYAAKGGAKTAGYPKYSGAKQIQEVAWYDHNSNWSIHTVKLMDPNELGLYDMSGNVWEWCQDIYVEYNQYKQINPQGGKRGNQRVLRGGSAYSSCSLCTHTYRFCQDKDTKDIEFGLRLALDA